MEGFLKNKAQLTSNHLIFIFSAFSGLAYYAGIEILREFIHFEKGFIHYAIACAFFFLAALLYVKSNLKQAGQRQLPFPGGIKILFLYFIVSGLSFFWGDAEGFKTQGYNMTLFYFGQWSVNLLELLTVILLCKITPIKSFVHHYIRGVEWGSFILAIVFIAFWLVGDKSLRLGGDYYDTPGVIHPTVLALRMAVGIFCSFHLYFKKSEFPNLPLWRTILFSSIMAFAMFLTFGKTILIAFSVACVLYLYKLNTTKKQKWIIIILVSLQFLLTLPFSYQYFYHIITHGDIKDLSGRTELWEATWSSIQEKPLWGHGINSPFPTLWWNIDKNGHSGQAHNEYLNAFYQMGLLGLFIICMIYISLFSNTVKKLCRQDVTNDSAFFLSMCVLMFINSLTQSFPVGFCMPIHFQALLFVWMSKHYKTNTYLYPLKSTVRPFGNIAQSSPSVLN